jgi:MFS family permease
MSGDPGTRESPNTSGQNQRRWTVLIFAAMITSGLALMARGPVVVELGTAFEAPAWQLGLIAPAGTLGYLLAIGVVGFGAGHVDVRQVVAVGLGGSGFAFLGMAAAPGLALFLAATGVRGAMNGAVRGVARPVLSHIYPDRRGRMYGYYDMMWAIGALAGPPLVFLAVALVSWRLAYVVLALTVGALAVAAWRLKPPADVASEVAVEWADISTLGRQPEVLAMALAIAVGVGLEGSLFLWLPTYAEAALRPELAGFSLSALIAGYIPGRLLHGRIAERVGYLRWLVPVFVLILPILWLTFNGSRGIWTLVGIAAIGLLLSALYPLLVSYATEVNPARSGPITAIAAIAASAGMGIVPGALGFVVSDRSAVAAMGLLVVPAALTCLILVVARGFERRRSGATGT